MACTSYFPEHGRTLTAISGVKPGDEATLSGGHTIGGGEFTTYRLGRSWGEDKWGAHLFSLDEAEIRLPHGGFIPMREADRLVSSYASTLIIQGERYERSAFGHYMHRGPAS